MGTPIINPPQISISAFGSIKKVIDPISFQKNNKIVVKDILTISHTFDHRPLDGAEAIYFTNTIGKFLEDFDLEYLSN